MTLTSTSTPARACLIAALLPALAAMAFVVTPSRADACSVSPCAPGALYPSQGTVPANIPAFLWHPDGGNEAAARASGADVSLTRVDGGRDEAVAIDIEPIDAGWYLVRPRAELTVEADYLLSGHADCSRSFDARIEARIHAGPVAPLPTTLGSTVDDGPTPLAIDHAVSDGSCFERTYSLAEAVSLHSTDDVLPWQDVLRYETTLDGAPYVSPRPWSPTSAPALHRGTDRVAYTCHDGDAPRMSIAIAAWLPGTDLRLVAAPVTLTPDCDLELVPSGGNCSTSATIITPCAPTLEPTGCSAPGGPTSTSSPPLIGFALAWIALARHARAPRRSATP